MRQFENDTTVCVQIAFNYKVLINVNMARENAIIDNFLEDLGYLSDDENIESGDEEDRRASKKIRISKLVPFYQTRRHL